jgi:parallel beta-helix repeat protein
MNTQIIPRRFILVTLALSLGCLTFIVASFIPAQAASQPTIPETDVSGHIVSDTTWMLVNSPYIVTSDVTVDSGVTLTVEAGVVVKFDSWDDDLHVYGTLNADGTVSEPIYFTSIDDNSVGGDSGTGNPGPEDWSSLRFYDTSAGNVLDYTYVRYGGGLNAGENVWVGTKDITITNSTIASAYGYGIYFNNVLPSSLSHNTFISNTSYAAYALLTNNSDSIILSDNNSSGNGDGSGNLGFNGFAVSGSISDTVSWDWEGNDTLPFVAHYDLTVNAGAHLTLTAGTIIKFDTWDGNMHVYGTLTAGGTEIEPIIFTSRHDDTVGGDTNGDGAATGPSPDNWSSLTFQNTSSGSMLDHAIVRYGGGLNASENIWVNTKDITITNSTIASAFGSGIYFDNALPPSLSHNTFISNTGYAVYALLTNNSDSIILRDNNSSGNGDGSGNLGYNGFAVTGSISDTVSWDWEGNDTLPFVAHYDLTVNAGAHLTLTAGTIVKFDTWDGNMHVYGTLTAGGTESEPIIFTSRHDDTVGGDSNGDGAATGPSPDNWSSLTFENTSSGSMLDHAIVRYGGGLHASENVWVSTKDITITNSTIASAFGSGIYFDNALPRSLSHNTLISNTGYAVYATLTNNSDSIILSDNNSSGNGDGSGNLGYNGFAVTGSISDTVSWDWEGNDTLPFVANYDLTVNEGAQLTLTPGTAVKFDTWGGNMLVYGSLIADGNESEPIIFTSEQDDAIGGDTNGDGATSSPAPDDWSSLVFYDTGSGSVLDHAIVRYGGGLHASENVWVSTRDITITNSTIASSAVYGIYFNNTLPPSLSHNTFISNTSYAAYALLNNNSDSIILSDNNSSGNGDGSGNLGYNGFAVTGSISDTVSWDWQGSDTLPFVVHGDLTVNEGSSLTLTPGTAVKFGTWEGNMLVYGSLIADGTESEPIIFTSEQDDTIGGDTNGDGAASSPAPDDWSSLVFYNTGSGSVLDHAIVRYGGGLHATENVWVNTSDIVLTNSTLEWALGRGLTLDGASPWLEGNTIRDNDIGVYAANGSLPTLRSNVIVSNTQYGLYNSDAAYIVDARQNWWGSASGPYHPIENAGGLGDRVSDFVRFDPWLGEFAWLAPHRSVLHETERLAWTVFGQDTTTMTTSLAFRRSGEAWDPLDSDLAPTDHFYWNTTDVDDGNYELRVQFSDALNQIVGELTREALVLNNEYIAWHNGRIDADETWTDDVLHLLAGDVTIAGGVSVTVDPGVIVKAVNASHLTIEDGAVLDAQGTPAAPIYFTSLADDAVGGDTNLDGEVSQPSPGDWSGISFQGSGQFIRSGDTFVLYFQVVHGGTLAANEIWAGSAVHVVSSQVVVPSGITLTIEPNAVIKFDDALGVTVQSGGKLVAQGNVAQPIFFTSLADDAVGGDTNKDGDRSTPYSGDWRGINVDGGQADLEYVVMNYGGGTSSGSWDNAAAPVSTRNGGAVTLVNSILRQPLFEGLMAWGSGEITSTNTVIAGADRGVNSDGSAIVRLNNCTLYDNRIGIVGHGGDLEIVNTIIANSLEYGLDILNSSVDIGYSNVWSASGTNYHSYPDQTGLNGNVSVDPDIVNPTGGNYRLQHVSPMIDAADGTAAPDTDFTGAPRYDDPRSDNTGLPTPGGVYADIGAYEFVETATSEIDLIVSNISGPAQIMAGETAVIQYTVTYVQRGASNQSPSEGNNNKSSPEENGASTVGPWHDTISLLSEFVGPVMELEVAEVLAEGSLGPGQSATFTSTVTAPGGTTGSYRWQVRVNSRGEVFEGQNWNNNTVQATSATTLDVPELVPGAPLTTTFPGNGLPGWFKFEQASGEETIVSLDSEASEGNNVLFAGFGYMPTGQVFDQRSTDWNSADALLPLPAPSEARTIYLLVMPDLPSGSNLDYTIVAQPAVFSIQDIGVSQGSNVGFVTVPIYGSQFAADLAAKLNPADGSPDITADPLVIVDSTTALATFDLSGASTGLADVVLEQDSQSVQLIDSFAIVSGPGGELQATLLIPEVVRIGRFFKGTIEYGNSGGTDLPAAILVLEGAATHPVWLDGEENEGRTTLQILTVSPELPSGGVLVPGEKHSLSFRSILNTTQGSYELTSKDSDSSDLVNWEALRLEVRPSEAEAVWDNAWEAMVANIGTTYGDYIVALAQAANEAHQYGVHTNIVGDLLNYMVARETINLTNDMVGGVLYELEGGQLVPYPEKAIILENQATGDDHLAGSWFDGRFGFWDVGPGTYTLMVPHVLTTSVSEITISASGILTGLEVVVDTGAQLSGRVVSALTGEPIADAVVTAEDVVSDRSYSGGTDGDGYYQITGIDPSLLKVTAISGLYAAPLAQVVDMTGGSDATLLLSLSTGGGVSGRVLSPGGAPVAAARVSAGLEDGQAASASIADEQGYFEIAGLAPGIYWVSANAPGYAYGLQIEVLVEDGVTADEVDVSLVEGGTVTGAITNANIGMPIGNATIASNDPFANNAPITTTVSGSYTFDDLPPGSADIFVSAEGYLAQGFPVTVIVGSSTNLDMSLRPAGTIAGTIQRVGGSALPDMPVSLVLPRGEILTAFSSAEGEFAFINLQDGDYALAAGIDAGLTAGRQTFTLSESGNIVTTTLELNFAELSGTVFRSDGVTPVNAASVWLVSDGDIINRSVADETGQYRFMMLQDGSVDLMATGQGMGMAWQESISLTVGTDVTDQDLLASTAILTVNVSAPSVGQPAVDAALVQLRPVDLATAENRLFGPVADCETDAAGSCLIAYLMPGDYELTVRGEGLASAHQAVTLPALGSTVNVVLVEGRQVNGRIVDDNQAGLAAWASAVSTSTEQGYLATADNAGNYALDVLPQGVFDMWFFDGRHQPVLVPDVDTTGTAVQSLDVTLPSSGAAITGTVNNDQGDPLAGAAVSMVDGQGTPLRSELTDPAGQYALTPLPTGPITLQVRAAGYSPVQIPVFIPSTITVTQNINLGDPIALATNNQITLLGEQRSVVAARSPLVIQGSSPVEAWVTGDVPPPKPSMSWDKMDEYISYPVLPYDCDPYHYYDKANRSREVVINTFYAWQYAYRAVQQVGLAEVNYAVFNGALVGSKAFLTIANLLNFNVDNVPSWAQADMLLAIDIMTSITTGSIDQSGLALSEWSSIVNRLGEGAEKYGGNLIAIVAMLRDFWLFYEDIQQAGRNIDTAMKAYQNANGQYVEAVRRHHLNMYLLRGTIAAYQKSGLCPPPDAPPPPEQPRTPQNGNNVNGVASGDPNDKSTIGHGPEGWITGDSTIIYTIRFENVPTATAAAQTIMITDELDANLDWSTFHLEELGFNNTVAFMTDGSPGVIQSYSTQVNVPTDPNPVNVSAWLDVSSGLITWEMESVDPVTGGWPEDPFAGLLPPNDDQHSGEGYAIYSILPKQGLANGDDINNEATIVFDVNEPILTNIVTNTIDLLAPTSSVDALPPTTTSTSFTITWSGDDSGGSGIASFDVYLSDDSGPFVAWQMGITETQAIFTGTIDHTYGFYSVATDNVGYRQSTPADSQATTTIVSETAIAGLQASSDSPTPLGQATNLTATITAGTNVTYLWDFGDGTSGNGDVTQHDYTSVGEYTALVTASNTFNTLTTTTQVVVDELIGGLTAGNDGPTALGDETTMTASVAAGSSVTYLWDFGDGNFGGGDVVQHMYAIAGEYTAIVTATNSVGLQTESTLVIVEEAIVGLTAGNNSPTILGSGTTLTVSVDAGSNVTYLWDFGDGAFGSGAVVQHTYAEIGEYTAIVTATNLVSMETTSTVVTILTDQYLVFIPTILKP